jgi:hypothetical protein
METPVEFLRRPGEATGSILIAGYGLEDFGERVKVALRECARRRD